MAGVEWCTYNALLSHSSINSMTADCPVVAAKVCVAEGCTVQLQDQPKYCIQRRLCPEHLKAPALKRKGHGDQLWRFCQQCGKLEPLHAFDGAKRNCRVQLAKRRAANSASNKGSSASPSGADSNIAGAATSSMLKTLGGGVRKASSIGGNLDKLAVQAHFLQQQQAQQQAQLPSYQPQQEGQLLLQQEQDVSSRLQRIKQQLASMEQQLALLQEQQQVEAQLAALQQQYDQMLQQHMRSQGVQTCLSGPLHLSGPNVAPLHTALLHNVNGGAFASLTSPAAMPVVSAASAPIPAVATTCPTNGISFVPMIGRSVSHGWPLGSAAAGAGAAAGFSGNLPPLKSSKSMPRPFGVMSAVSSPGLSAPVPSLPTGLFSGSHASTSGPLPSGYFAGGAAGNDLSNSQPLLLQPGAMHAQAAGLSGMGVGGHAAVSVPQVGRHMPLLHVDDLPFSDDIPDLESFLAAGGNLQPAGISSAHNALFTSSTSNAVNQLTSSAQNTSAANPAPGAAHASESANTLEGFLSPSLSAGQVPQGCACMGQAAGMASQHSISAEAPVQLQTGVAGQHSMTEAPHQVQAGMTGQHIMGQGLPPYVPAAWAPGYPPAGPAAAAPAAAAGVNVFGRRPGNTSAHNKPGRSSLDMFTGLLEDVLAEIQAEHEANEAAAGQGAAHAMSAPVNAAHNVPQHSQQLQDNGFFN